MLRLKHILNLIGVLFIILLSNTVYFGLIKRKETLFGFILIILLNLLIYRKISRKNFNNLLILALIFSFNFILNSNIIDKSYVTNLLQILVLFTGVAIIVGNSTKEEFVVNYVNIMCVFALISLVFNFIANIYPEIANRLYIDVDLNGAMYKTSPLYTWGWDNLFSRNSGPFWEPGAFQGFLIIAIIGILTYKDIINGCKKKMLLLAITLITTQSTTAYILFLVISLTFHKEIKSMVKSKNILFKFIVTCLILLGVLVVIKSGNISNKLQFSNVSTAKRGNDFIKSIELFINRPINGYGFGMYNINQELSVGIRNNSNGILYLLYSQGIVFFTYYLIRFIKGLMNTFNVVNINKGLIITITFLILYSTEGLVFLPMYMVFIFEYKNLNSLIIRKNKHE